MTLVRTFLVDDHRMLTEALAAKLSDDADIWVVGNATTNGPGLLDTVAALHPDVVVIEFYVPGSRGTELLHDLTARMPGLHVVVLTGCRDANLVVDAARAGVDAWVPKESSTEYLLTVLRTVLLGYAWFPPEHLGNVLRRLRQDTRSVRQHADPLQVLSAKQREVLLGLVEGTQRDELAAQLGVTPNTIRTHVRNIFKKLGVHSGLEAVKLARSAGMTPRIVHTQWHEGPMCSVRK